MHIWYLISPPPHPPPPPHMTSINSAPARNFSNTLEPVAFDSSSDSQSSQGKSDLLKRAQISTMPYYYI